MRILYHHTLSPFARKIRLMLAEKHLQFDLREERYWERSHAFLALNPAGEVPVLKEEDGRVIADHTALAEYLDESYPEPPLLGRTPELRAETRRLVGWFDGKFYCEVTTNLAGEKMVRRHVERAAPDSRAVRAGRSNLHTHLSYIGWLTERRSWLAGDHLGLADLAAAAQISLVDYLGDVPWDEHPPAKEWYVRLKSRPAFRALLKDTVPGIPPAPVYANLDF